MITKSCEQNRRQYFRRDSTQRDHLRETVLHPGTLILEKALLPATEIPECRYLQSIHFCDAGAPEPRFRQWLRQKNRHGKKRTENTEFFSSVRLHFI
jgi:hypothetical protein